MSDKKLEAEASQCSCHIDIVQLESELEQARLEIKILKEAIDKTCKWQYDDGYYETECGESWFFDSGDIEENGVKFCMFCRGNVIAKSAKEK